jgi:lysozyme
VPDASPCADLESGQGAFPSYPYGHSIRGFDASTDVAWATAKARGLRFAFLQTSVAGRPNEAFARGWAMARACGIPRGAYFLLSPTGDAGAQAERLVSAITGDPGELPPVVDVELTPGCKAPCCAASATTWATAVAKALETVEHGTGRAPLLYTVADFWKECLENTSRFAKRPLWLAGYPTFDAAPRPGFGGWQRWVFYQAAGNARLGKGVVDTDVFGGDEAAFTALVGPR